MLPRRFIPPEYLPTRSLARSVSPMISSTSSTRERRAAPRRPYIFPQKVRFSRADRSL